MLLDFICLPGQAVAAPLVGILLSSIVLYFAFFTNSQCHIPLVNGGIGARKRFLGESESLMREGSRKSKNGFYLVTDSGRMLVLPMSYGPSVRDTKGLSFPAIAKDLFHWHIKGFEAFQPNHVSHEMINKVLTRKLESLISLLSKTSTATLQAGWTNCHDWHELTLFDSILKMFTHISSRIFVGEELANDPAWIQLLHDYMVDAFAAGESLRRWPLLLRPMVANFVPSVHKARRHLQRAREILNPRVAQRAAASQGDSGLDWIAETASALGEEYDPAATQLGLALGSVNTAADMVTQLIFDLCGRDALIHDLRLEMIAVLTQEEHLHAGRRGGSRDTNRKALVYKLKLLDSVMKESQRLKPLGSVMVARLAQRTVTLPGGIILPKGSYVGVSNYDMRRPDSQWGDQFDGYRFYNLRASTGDETWTQFVSTGPKFMGFGYGQYACPGRFFAAQEIKIFMCHLLLKYDFKLVDGEGQPPAYSSGFALLANPTGRVCVRRRNEEIDVDKLLG